MGCISLSKVTRYILLISKCFNLHVDGLENAALLSSQSVKSKINGDLPLRAIIVLFILLRFFIFATVNGNPRVPFTIPQFI